MANSTHPIRGSNRAPVEGARSTGPADPNERVEVSIRIRPRAWDQVQSRVDEGAAQHLTHQEFEARHGADPSDFDKVAAFAKQQGLVVVEQSIPRRTVVVSGTVAQLEAAFGVKLQSFEY